MDNLRLIYVITLVFLGMMIWQQWQEDYVKPKPVASQQQTTVDVAGEVSQKDVPVASVDASSATAVPTVGEAKAEASSKIIEIETDVLNVKIDTKGGTLVKADLLDYSKSTEEKDKTFVLLNGHSSNLFLIQSGLIGSKKEDAPTHRSIFQSEKTKYRLQDGKDELIVPLVWTSPSGVQVGKIFTFRRGDYLISLKHKVVNGSNQTWAGRDYRQLVRGEPTVSTEESAFIVTYTGGAYYTPENKFSKIDFEELAEKLELEVTGGWTAMIQHYFFAGIIPPAKETQTFYSKKLSGQNRYILGGYGQALKAEPGQSVEFDGKLWVGPKIQQRIEKIAPGFELTVDYGFLTIIAKPLFWLLDFINQAVGNWGWSIIFLTILIKLAFYRLSAASYRSMAGMKKLGPRLQSMKEKYGDDKERLNKAMMDLYKTEKINPVGGCLPILVQIPVFIALYWVLLESVELRDAPWMLWIDSLSAKDPYFILPVLMGASMFIQQKLNPAPPDPMQAKIMMSLPFVFTAMFAFFPAGLVLYWVVNNILSIAQQWRITKVMEQEGKN